MLCMWKSGADIMPMIEPKYVEETNTYHIVLTRMFHTAGRTLGWKDFMAGLGFRAETVTNVLARRAYICCYLEELDQTYWIHSDTIEKFMLHNNTVGFNGELQITYLPPEIFESERPGLKA